MLGPFGITHVGVPQAPNYELSPAKANPNEGLLGESFNFVSHFLCSRYLAAIKSAIFGKQGMQSLKVILVN